MIKYIIWGIILIAADAFLMRQFLHAGSKCKTTATARIVDVRYSNFGRDGDLYTPVLEFYADGQNVRGECVNLSGSGDSRKYHTGDTVEIRYNPETPAEFVLESKSNRGGILLTTIGLLLGIGLLIVGIRMAF